MYTCDNFNFLRISGQSGAIQAPNTYDMVLVQTKGVGSTTALARLAQHLRGFVSFNCPHTTACSSGHRGFLCETNPPLETMFDKEKQLREW